MQAGHLAAGVSVFELARVMGTSVLMIERAYGTLLDGAGAGIASRLNSYDAEVTGGSEDATKPIGHKWARVAAAEQRWPIANRHGHRRSSRMGGA